MATKQAYRRPNYDPVPKNLSGIKYFYQMLVGWAVVLNIKDDELIIVSEVSPALRQSIEARKTALVKHIRSLPK